MKSSVFILGLMTALMAVGALPASGGVILVRFGELPPWTFHSTNHTGNSHSGAGIRQIVNGPELLPLAIDGADPWNAIVEGRTRIVFRQIDWGVTQGTDLLSICLLAANGWEPSDWKHWRLDDGRGLRAVSSRQTSHRTSIGGSHEDPALYVWKTWDLRNVLCSTERLPESNAAAPADFLVTNPIHPGIYDADQVIKNPQLSSGFRGLE